MKSCGVGQGLSKAAVAACRSLCLNYSYQGVEVILLERPHVQGPGAMLLEAVMPAVGFTALPLMRSHQQCWHVFWGNVKVLVRSTLFKLNVPWRPQNQSSWQLRSSNPAGHQLDDRQTSSGDARLQASLPVLQCYHPFCKVSSDNTVCKD